MGDWDWAAEGHCVTLINGIAADELIDVLDASTVARVRGIGAVAQRTIEHRGDDYNPDEAVIAVTPVGPGWVLIAEVNGYLGVTEHVIGPLSDDRTIVSHFRNVNAVSRFHWWRDQQLLVDVDLLFPTERFGTDPDALLDALHSVGIPLDPDSEEIASMDLTAAGFALAERITGVRCTPELFEQADFSVAVVAIPGAHDN